MLYKRIRLDILDIPGSKIRAYQFLENNRQDSLIPPSMIPRLWGIMHCYTFFGN
ncbi:MAG: hypothetical protein LBG43_11200 [Treponema sp.]|nr:hypothetical protein [Treponema sp.]